MLSDDDYKIPEGDFIPGIYNYCDRWCERCMYTSRCMNYAMGESIEKEIEKGKRIERSMEENKEFWQQIEQAMHEAADLIDEEFRLGDGINSNPAEADEEDDPEALAEYKALQKKADEHNLVSMSKKYMLLVHQWLKKENTMLRQTLDEESGRITCSYPGLDAEQQKQLTEAMELVRWFNNMIPVKVRRAVTSQMDEENQDDLFEGMPKDSYGSAMVALKGINSSISGFTYLYRIIKPEAETIKSFLHMLWWLKTHIENSFPGALTFVWPPAEE